MPRFKVHVCQMWTMGQDIEVEAATPEEAEQLAYDEALERGEWALYSAGLTETNDVSQLEDTHAL